MYHSGNRDTVLTQVLIKSQQDVIKSQQDVIAKLIEDLRVQKQDLDELTAEHTHLIENFDRVKERLDDAEENYAHSRLYDVKQKEWEERNPLFSKQKEWEERNPLFFSPKTATSSPSGKGVWSAILLLYLLY